MQFSSLLVAIKVIQKVSMRCAAPLQHASVAWRHIGADVAARLQHRIIESAWLRLVFVTPIL
jgi:hypothetical protein